MVKKRNLTTHPVSKQIECPRRTKRVNRITSRSKKLIKKLKIRKTMRNLKKVDPNRKRRRKLLRK